MVIHCWHYSCDKLFYLTISSAAAAEPIPIVQVTDCLCGCRQTFFSNRCFSFSDSFSLIFTKLGTQDLCANMQENCGTIKILILKIMENF